MPGKETDEAQESWYRRAAIAGGAMILGVIAALIVSGSTGIGHRPPPPPPRTPGRMVDHSTWMIYLPGDWKPEQRCPLVFALSPGGDARSMIAAWMSVANRHHWLVAASKEFHNSQEFARSVREIGEELDDVGQIYPFDPARVILTGLSGGGMGAHAVARFLPGRVAAVVVNTGMMEKTFMTDAYPEGKLAVFLASPTDFRYSEMQRDRQFLESRHWRTKWIEFAGGHVMAPARTYEEAAEWLAKNLP